MKKQGFTLIELMVVIVIMGILAAVAVPKLFGMIAKSKASEVPTAAGTWINMMEAYGSENYKVGDWGQIGYTAPGSKLASGTFQSNEFHYEGADGTWTAWNLHKLDDCASAINWQVKVKKSDISAGDATFTSTVLNQSTCLALTPNFEKIGK